MPAVELLYEAGFKALEQHKNASLGIINAQLHGDFPRLIAAAENVSLQQSLKSDFDALEQWGLQPKVKIDGEFDVILVFPVKNKVLNLSNVAKAMFSLKHNGKIIMACANAYGAKSYDSALKKLAGQVASSSKSKCRVFSARKDDAFDAQLAETWLQAAEVQRLDTHGLYTQAGLFSWDRADIGSQLLLGCLFEQEKILSGTGMDLCCGYGLLSDAILKHNQELSVWHMVDADADAVRCAEKNTVAWQEKTQYHWLDARQAGVLPKSLDWVVCNPPFHTGQQQDVELGQMIVAQGCQSLKRAAKIYMVANRKLPYEAVLDKHLRQFDVLLEKDGFKVIRGVR